MWQIALFLCLQTDPVDYVENLCENMQLFQKEDFLTGDQLLFEYKPEVNILWTLIICFDVRKTCAYCVIQAWVIKHNAGTGFVLIGTLFVFRRQICFVSLFFLHSHWEVFAGSGSQSCIWTEILSGTCRSLLMPWTSSALREPTWFCCLLPTKASVTSKRSGLGLSTAWKVKQQQELRMSGPCIRGSERVTTQNAGAWKQGNESSVLWAHH